MKLIAVFAIAFGAAALVTSSAPADDAVLKVAPAVYRVDSANVAGPPVQFVYHRGGYYYGGGGGWGYRGYGYGGYYRPYYRPYVYAGPPVVAYPAYGYGYPAYGYGYPAYGYGYPGFGYGYGPRVSVGVGVW
jgi:hypothetical protein